MLVRELQRRRKRREGAARGSGKEEETKRGAPKRPLAQNINGYDKLTNNLEYIPTVHANIIFPPFDVMSGGPNVQLDTLGKIKCNSALEQVNKMQQRL